MLFNVQMSWLKKYRIGTIWAVLTSIYGVCITIWPFDNNPKITFYEISKQDVFSLRDTIGSLKIYCNGVDLRKSGLGLRTYTVKLINEGKSDVKIGDYGDPIGIPIINGKIIGVKTERYSDRELADNIIDKKNSDSTKIVLNKIFIGHGKYVVLQLWILYDSKKEPSISSHLLGQVANTTILYKAEQEESGINWEGLILVILIGGGSIFVFIYFLDFLDFCIVHGQRFFREKVFNNYYGVYINDTDEQGTVRKIYSLLGRKLFIEVLKILNDKEKLNQEYVNDISNEKLAHKFKELLAQKKISVDSGGFFSGSVVIKNKSKLLYIIDILINTTNYLIKTENNEIEIVNDKFSKEIEMALKIILPVKQAKATG